MQNMTEEAVELKSDLRHTSMARARAEGREEKAREGLRVAEGDLREVKDGMQTASNELKVVKEGLQTAQNELRVVREELQAARDELLNKAMLLDRARYEASGVESSIERLTNECHALRRDLQRQVALVVQRDEAIASLRDETCTQWASRWLAFQRRVADAYPGLDLNFDIPSDEEAEESFSADCSREPTSLVEVCSPSSPYAPNPAPDVCASLYHSACFLSTLGFGPGIYVTSFLALILDEYPIFHFFALLLIVFLVLLCLS